MEFSSSVDFPGIHRDTPPTDEECHDLRLLTVASTKPSESGIEPDNQFHTMSALEILRETVRILRYNSTAFVVIAILLICPVSAVFLSNVLIDESTVKMLTIRLVLIARSSGLPLMPMIEHSCQRFAESILSSAVCFPLFVTFSLLSKAAVVHTVDCTHAKRRFEAGLFLALVRNIWNRLVTTYVSVCLAIVGCLTTFLVLLGAVCSTFYALGFSPDLIISVAVIGGLVFSVIFANAVIICNIGIVICVLEDVAGPGALLRSCVLIRGQTQVGLLIFLGSTIGTVFVEGLFEHRVKILSYGDGSSRIWEGPLLVVMYSFVVLTDSVMNAVFYFSCRSSSMVISDDSVSDGSIDDTKNMDTRNNGDQILCCCSNVAGNDLKKCMKLGKAMWDFGHFSAIVSA
ncbi:uncharacterized protein LOC111449285 isoform X1 [Cucurbita moschata]|uniref:Uncharacterized protein LOC111449285 isoform X1 n=1 Tax=Cucurbita moschata TaxID=3662 RepID=A0A6J1FZA9_CUCMO|nr:uncharacterized protein LOC111449285 isoform X1 [Cucurbita moschata]